MHRNRGRSYEHFTANEYNLALTVLLHCSPFVQRAEVDERLHEVFRSFNQWVGFLSFLFFNSDKIDFPSTQKTHHESRPTHGSINTCIQIEVLPEHVAAKPKCFSNYSVWSQTDTQSSQNQVDLSDSFTLFFFYITYLNLWFWFSLILFHFWVSGYVSSVVFIVWKCLVFI